MILWLLPSNQVRFSHLVFAVNDSQIATVESSKLSTSGICFEWFPNCYPSIKQDCHIWSLLQMIPWLLPSNQARFPHLVFSVNDSSVSSLESSEISTLRLCCELFPDCYPRIKQDLHSWTLLWMIPWLLSSNQARFPHMVFAVNDSLIATHEWSKVFTTRLCCERFPGCYRRIQQDFLIWYFLWMIPWLLPSTQARIAQGRQDSNTWSVFAVNDSLIATLESSKIFTSGLCCEWFPDCYRRIKHDFHIWYLLWMIPWLLPLNTARFPHLVFAVNDFLICNPRIESSQISTPGLCCECFPDCYTRIKQNFHTWSLLCMIPRLLPSNRARFPQLVFDVNDFPIASLESSKMSTPGLCCKLFPGCYPRIKQDFNTWSLLWMFPLLLPSNQARYPLLFFAVNDSLIATLESSKISTSGLCCEWFLNSWSPLVPTRRYLLDLATLEPRNERRIRLGRCLQNQIFVAKGGMRWYRFCRKCSCN